MRASDIPATSGTITVEIPAIPNFLQLIQSVVTRLVLPNLVLVLHHGTYRSGKEISVFFSHRVE